MHKERPTVEVKTPNGHVVIVKAFATGRESNELQNIYLASAKISVVGNVPRIDGFDPKAEEQVINKMIELLVISVDGESTDVVNTVLDMNVVDYQAVVEKLNEVTGKKKANSTNSQ